MNASLLLALSLVSATVNVDDYLDPNETHQHYAIQRAAQAAGAGGVVLFTAGSTYELGQGVSQYEGQTWRTDGSVLATIRRANEVTTTLIADAGAGATSIRVADPSAFVVNDYVSPLLPGGGEKEGQLSFTKVTDISGDTLTLNRGLSYDFSTGNSIVNTTRMITVANEGRLESLRIDGNAAGNDSFVSWRIHNDVLIPKDSSNAVVRDMEFINAQGNSLYVTADDTLIENSTFTGGNLAAVHIGSTENFSWINNRVVDTNQQYLRGGHSAGGFTFSLNNLNTTIRGGSFEDIDTFAIGTAHPGTNHDILVEGVTFLNNENVWDSNTTADNPAHIALSFIGNTMINSGQISLIGKNGNYIEEVLLTDNQFEGSGLYLKNIIDAMLFRNEFDEASWQTVISSYFGRFSPADLDNDGDIDTLDLTTFFQNFTGDVGEEGGKDFLLGDTDGDGDVDTLDITIAFQRFTGDLGGDPQPYNFPPDELRSSYEEPETNAVPEPGSFLLAACGGLLLLTFSHYRKRRT